MAVWRGIRNFLARPSDGALISPATEETIAAFRAEAKAESDATQVLLAASEVARDADAAALQARADLLATEATQVTVHSRLVEIRDNFLARINTLGQKASAASLPVVLSSEQEAIAAAHRDAAKSDGYMLSHEMGGNPNPVFREDLLGYLATYYGAGVDIACSISRAIDARTGLPVLLVSTAVASTATVQPAVRFQPFSVAGGQALRVSARIRVLGAGATAASIAGSFKNSAGAVVSFIDGATELLIDGGYRTLHLTTTVPTATSYASLDVRVAFPSGTPPEAKFQLEELRWWIDGVEQRLDEISAKLPATLGQKSSALSLATALSTEQEAMLALRYNAAAALLDMQQSTTQKVMRLERHGANEQYSYNVRAPTATAVDAASHEVLRQRRVGPATALAATYSRSGATVTVTTPSAHNFETGDLAYHTGATDTGLNGYAKVTVAGATTYTFTTGASGAATGAVTVKTMGDEFRYRSGVALTALESGW